MKSKYIIAVSAILMYALLAGCAAEQKNTETQTETVAATQATTQTETQAQTEGITLSYSQEAQEKYALPENFTLDYTPERLVVMTLGPGEILHELGVKMVAVPDIIDENTQWAKELDAERLPFTAKTIDTEGLLELKPDMIIMSVSKKEAYGDFFEEKGIPVYYTVTASMDSGSIEEVKSQVKLYGEGFKRSEETAELMNRFAQLEEDVEQFKKNNTSLQGQKMMILLEAPFTYTNTSKTTLGDMMKSLGYANMADNIENLESVMGTSTLQISSEVIIEQNPPMIIAQPSGVGAGISITQEEYKNTITADLEQNASVWANVDAVKNNKILYLGTDVFPGTTGLGIFDSYEYLMEALPAL